jgi:hypothetical protein
VCRACQQRSADRCHAYREGKPTMSHKTILSGTTVQAKLHATDNSAAEG